MKPNKGFITVLMMVLISISLSTFSRAAFDTFSDVPNDSPFHESIFYLAERGMASKTAADKRPSHWNLSNRSLSSRYKAAKSFANV